MYKVLKLNNISSKGIQRFDDDKYEVASEFSTPDAIIMRSHKLQTDEIAESILGIARAGVGVNNIPVDFCTEKGVVVFNTPGANANAVKELIVAALCLGSRDILGGIRYSESLAAMTDKAEMNTLLEKEKKNYKGNELKGKTIGIVGLGAIGSMVADTALSLGMNVLGYDPAISVEAAWRLSSDIKRVENLQSLFTKSDYITLHLPVLDVTRGLINKDLLSNAKPGLCLLNFAREEIVDTPAVIDALQNDQLGQYIADFPSPGLIGVKNTILMPHIGASTEEAEENCAVMAAEQLKDFIENGNIKNSVNFPAVNLERSSDIRLVIINENKPKMLGNMLNLLADDNLNVVDMINKSRNDIAYNLIDVESVPADALIEKMRMIDGVIGVRVIK